MKLAVPRNNILRRTWALNIPRSSGLGSLVCLATFLSALLFTPASLAAGFVEVEGNSIRLHSAALRPPPREPRPLVQVPRHSLVAAAQAASQNQTSKPGLVSVSSLTGGPIADEAPFYWAFAPDGYLLPQWNRLRPASERELHFLESELWPTAPRGNANRSEPISYRSFQRNAAFLLLKSLHGDLRVRNSAAAAAVLKLAQHRTNSVAEIEMAIQNCDPALSVSGRPAPDEFARRDLVQSRIPQYRAALEQARQIRTVRLYFNTHLVGPKYDFEKGGYQVWFAGETDFLFAHGNTPALGFLRSGTPVLVPLPEPEARALQASGDDFSFCLEVTGNLVSDEPRASFLGKVGLAPDKFLVDGFSTKLYLLRLPRGATDPSAMKVTLMEAGSHLDAPTAKPEVSSRSASDLQPDGSGLESRASADSHRTASSTSTAQSTSPTPNDQEVSASSLERYLTLLVDEISKTKGTVDVTFEHRNMFMSDSAAWIRENIKAQYTNNIIALARRIYPGPQSGFAAEYPGAHWLSEFAAYATRNLSVSEVGDTSPGPGADRQRGGQVAEVKSAMGAERFFGVKMVQEIDRVRQLMTHPVRLFVACGKVGTAGKTYYLGMWTKTTEGWRLVPFLNPTLVEKQELQIKRGEQKRW